MDLLVLTELWDSLPLLFKIIGVLVALHPVFSIIVAATPTPKDDTLYAKFYSRVLEPLALVIFKAKDK